MYALSSPAFWYCFFTEFRCYRCGSLDGFVSRPRNLFERYGLRLLRMRPSRCGECYRRSYRPLRVPLLPRPEDFKFDCGEMLTSASAAEHKGTQKETKEGDGGQQRIA